MKSQLKSNRYNVEEGLLIAVQIPQSHAEKMLEAIYQVVPLKYGDYDRVSFRTAIGTQNFRTLPTARNMPTEDTVSVQCQEIQFFVPNDTPNLPQILETIYSQHPYEEPVVFVNPTNRTLHIRGTDEDNPNRFWNNENQDWLPDQHRK